MSEERLVDIEIKASSASETFYMADQNYKFEFNTSAIPPVSPPIDAPEFNPSDRSLHIVDEGAVSSFVQLDGATAFFDFHTTVGSIAQVGHINVTLAGGDGCF